MTYADYLREAGIIGDAAERRTRRYEFTGIDLSILEDCE